MTAPPATDVADAAVADGLARPALVLRSSQFRRGREGAWKELEGLLARVERSGLAALSVDELQRLPLLYRSTMSALSVARAIALDRHLLLYLENLGLRAFLVVYGPRESLLDQARDFFVRGFPAAVRACRLHVLLSFLALAVGTAAGFMLVTADEQLYFGMFVPAGLGDDRGPNSTRAQLLDHELFAPWPGFTSSFVTFANMLFRHNALVGIFTFGLGIAAGVPTLLMLVYQGTILGAFLALHANRDLLVDCLGWLSIHGVTELLALILCGAGGLVIGQHILFPGRYSRVDSLAVHGRGAAQLAVGAVFLLFVAGLLEGGLRQLVGNTTGRFAIAGVTATLWLSYFVFAGRGHRP